MSLIDTIRNKPRAYKVRLIWITAVLAVILMIVIWILASGFAKRSQADTTLFRTIGRGLKDIKENYGK